MDVISEINELLSKASKDKRVLEHLKQAAVRGQSYALAGYLRETEKELFPETAEDKEAKDISKKADLILRMVEIGSNPSSAYRIYKAIELYLKKKGKFDLKDASKIISDSERIFNEKN